MKCICHLTGHRHYEMATEREERVLVVIGGRIIESPFENNSTEVIFESNDLANQFFVSYPHDRVETCGGLVDYRIIVCGGIEDNGGMGMDDLLLDTVSKECYLFNPLTSGCLFIL